MLITVDGITGSGKSTQVHGLAHRRDLDYVNFKSAENQLRHLLNDGASTATTILTHLLVTDLHTRADASDTIGDHYWELLFAHYANCPGFRTSPSEVLDCWRGTAERCGIAAPVHSFIFVTTPGIADMRRIYRDFGVKLDSFRPGRSLTAFYDLFRQFAEILCGHLEFCHLVNADPTVEAVTEAVEAILNV